MNGGTGRVAIGTSSGSSSSVGGVLNVAPLKDNGLLVKCLTSKTVGITVRMREKDDVAIKVIDDLNKSNFSVLNNGEVYARKYTTTLSNIPDYVFEKDYSLMSLKELERYILDNKHLPNIPSAKEYGVSGVDLGEMNRVLLEKVEELTLYVIDLNKEIEQLKNKKDEE